MPTKTKPQIYHFHVTQQLGFKQVVHCWCGAVLDLNQQYKQRATTKAWLAEHEWCESPDVVSHKPKVYE
jgi:hypothetical protein